VPTVNLDLYPTFLDIAQGKVPEGVTLDGESLVPILKGTGSLQRQSVFWHFPGYLDVPVNRGRDNDFRTRPTSVIRKGDWKLHLFHEEWVLDGGRAKIDTNNSVELYNTKDDIGERTNLAATNKQKRDELLDDLLAWFKETQAKLPTPLPSTN
jgi:arylsulfatase A-like enzyme